MITHSQSANADPLTDDVRIPVVELCRIAGIKSNSWIYREAKAGRAPVSRNGVTLGEARDWLLKRAAKKAARTEALKRLKELAESLGASDITTPRPPATISGREVSSE
jgi:hypothetical protein